MPKHQTATICCQLQLLGQELLVILSFTPLNTAFRPAISILMVPARKSETRRFHHYSESLGLCEGHVPSFWFLSMLTHRTSDAKLLSWKLPTWCPAGLAASCLEAIDVVKARCRAACYSSAVARLPHERPRIMDSSNRGSCHTS